MTRLGSSSSAAESSMDTTTSNTTVTKTTNKRNNRRSSTSNSREEGHEEIWSTFNTSFKQVQSVLDRNRALIQQVNENHQSKIADNMVKNVALIQELNGNISKVVSLYSDLSTNFSSAFQYQQKKNVAGERDSEEA